MHPIIHLLQKLKNYIGHNTKLNICTKSNLEYDWIYTHWFLHLIIHLTKILKLDRAHGATYIYIYIYIYNLIGCIDSSVFASNNSIITKIKILVGTWGTKLNSNWNSI